MDLGRMTVLDGLEPLPSPWLAKVVLLLGYVSNISLQGNERFSFSLHRLFPTWLSGLAEGLLSKWINGSLI